MKWALECLGVLVRLVAGHLVLFGKNEKGS
jgi:hypothetical protein